MDSFLPAWLVKEVSRKKIRAHFLNAELLEKKQHAQSTLQPWICNADLGSILDIPEGTPIFRNEWIHYLVDGRIASISETYLTANALVMIYESGP